MLRKIRPFRVMTALLMTFSLTSAPADDLGATCCPSKASIMKMSRDELFCLFKSLPEGEVPRAYYQGTVIARGPAPLRPGTAAIVSLVWQGKYVMPEEGMMINKVCGQAKITAEYFTDASWLDGRQATIFDYRCSSAQFARDARDEVRPLCPGMYLGLMWIRQPDGCPKASSFFLLEHQCKLTGP
jgi:hypothetical protein